MGYEAGDVAGGVDEVDGWGEFRLVFQTLDLLVDGASRVEIRPVEPRDLAQGCLRGEASISARGSAGQGVVAGGPVAEALGQFVFALGSRLCL